MKQWKLILSHFSHEKSKKMEATKLSGEQFIDNLQHI
jgi:hypothetical protein